MRRSDQDSAALMADDGTDTGSAVPGEALAEVHDRPAQEQETR